MSEIGILEIHGVTPEPAIDAIERGRDLGVDASFVTKRTGFLKLPQLGPKEFASDLAEQAVRKAFAAHPGLDRKIGLLIVITQNPDAYGLPHTAAILHGKLDLPTNIAAFDISLGCSGWVYALSIAKSFMGANGVGYGLIVTADPYSKIVTPDDRNTALLFGDAAAVTVLGPDPQWRIGRFVFGTEGSLRDNLVVDETGRLFMNGRSIFTFSATAVPTCIRETLSLNELALGDLDRIVLHQASRYIVETIGERLGCPEKVPFVASKTGNTVSSSIPLAFADGVCADDRTVLVSGFGVGLSWAATVLRRRPN